MGLSHMIKLMLSASLTPITCLSQYIRFTKNKTRAKSATMLVNSFKISSEKIMRAQFLDRLFLMKTTIFRASRRATRTTCFMSSKIRRTKIMTLWTNILPLVPPSLRSTSSRALYIVGSHSEITHFRTSTIRLLILNSSPLARTSKLDSISSSLGTQTIIIKIITIAETLPSLSIRQTWTSNRCTFTNLSKTSWVIIISCLWMRIAMSFTRSTYWSTLIRKEESSSRSNYLIMKQGIADSLNTIRIQNRKKSSCFSFREICCVKTIKISS